MIPIRDTIRSRTAPVVTVALIVVNVMVFLHEIALGPYIERFVYAYGLIPRRFVYWPGAPLDPMRFLPLFTSMFWHGGWLHLIGNMVFLWVFGNNIEDVMGHGKFLIFYLLCGVVAAATQTFVSPHSLVPMVGASGAISGVLGAYILLYPNVRVHTLILLPFFITTVALPAWVMLGYWILIQVLSGLGSLSEIEKGGVAFFAHVGGFIAGLVLVKLFASEDVLRRRPLQPASYYRYRTY